MLVPTEIFAFKVWQSFTAAATDVGHIVVVEVETSVIEWRNFRQKVTGLSSCSS